MSSSDSIALSVVGDMYKPTGTFSYITKPLS